MDYWNFCVAAAVFDNVGNIDSDGFRVLPLVIEDWRVLSSDGAAKLEMISPCLLAESVLVQMNGSSDDHFASHKNHDLGLLEE
mmetsp:Transcript_16814/g.38543  ORF Transcript_16814/g.38543 Transcript_16814/m.38543 type:complete len:83 (+) Transcript_16814:1202-1450(+)